MTREEVVSLLSGASDWESAAVERVGVPAIRFSDGPSGVRGVDWLSDASWNTPCGAALGATWSPAAVRSIGRLLGQDAQRKGVGVHLAPNLNLHRTPVGGRNFECFAEDPMLAARLGTSYVDGVQGEGVLSCPKHFVCNDTETARFTVDVQVDDPALREVYLRPFETVLREGQAGAVMAAYNAVNGTTMSEHRTLLTDVLRGEWGFEGPVVSDWYCVRSTVEAVAAGCDLEMPGPARLRGEALLDALEADPSLEEVVRSAAARLVRAAMAIAHRPGIAAPDLMDAEGAAVLRSVAARSMVLLRNEEVGGGRALPIDPSTVRTLAVVGPNARSGQFNGGGSAIVRPRDPSHPLDALRRRVPSSTEVRYAEGCSIHRTTPVLDTALCGPMVLELSTDPGFDWGTRAERRLTVDTTKLLWFRDPFDRPGPPRFAARLRTTFVPDRSGHWKLGIRSVGDLTVRVDETIVLDNTDVPLPPIVAMGKAEQLVELDLLAGVEYRLDLRLVRRDGDDGLSAAILTAARPAMDDLVDEAVAAADGADVAVVVVGTNADWESEGRDRADLALPGDQDELIRRVAEVARKTVVVVNAGSPVAMPWLELVDAVLVAWFPGEGFGDALADVLLGAAEPAGRLPVTFPHSLEASPFGGVPLVAEGAARYAESVMVGHRWYEAHGQSPLFPFGHGLGFGDVRVVSARLDTPGSVRVEVEHTGGLGTDACVQVYARADGEPFRRLAGFGRVALEPGGREEVEVALDARTFERWTGDDGWMRAPGPFELWIGTSALDLPLRLVVDRAV